MWTTPCWRDGTDEEMWYETVSSSGLWVPNQIGKYVLKLTPRVLKPCFWNIVVSLQIVKKVSESFFRNKIF